MFRIILALLSCLAFPALAQDRPIPPAAAAPAGGTARIPADLADLIALQPRRFVDRAATVILGFGMDGAIDAPGIELSITLDRADTRATVLGRLLEADLDNDGALDASEVDLRAATLPPRLRATLRRGFAGADRAGTGRAGADDLRRHAAAQAIRSLTDRAADERRALMLFDRDGNGCVTLAEVETGVAEVLRAAETLNTARSDI